MWIVPLAICARRARAMALVEVEFGDRTLGGE
jgi:hypothetical protein